jgi:hypothetical protein
MDTLPRKGQITLDVQYLYVGTSNRLQILEIHEKTQNFGPRITPNDEEMNNLALGHSKNFSTFGARAADDAAREIPAGLWQ